METGKSMSKPCVNCGQEQYSHPVSPELQCPEYKAPDRVDCLHLDIIKTKCQCGHEWTHSQLWLASRAHGYMGGTPTSEQERTLRVESMVESRDTTQHCFKCVSVTLGKSWISSRDLKILELKNAHKEAFDAELLS